MKKENRARPQDLIGIYGELAEIVGIDDAIIIYEHFKGQQISFPTRLYSKEYIIEQVTSDKSQSIRKQATKYGYSERRLRQMIQGKNDSN